MFVGIGETNYQDWIWTVATGVTDTPLKLEFLNKQRKKYEPNNGYREILSSLRILGITPNARIIQPSKISCWATYYS